MSHTHRPKTFQAVLRTLEDFWAQQGCVILQPYDMEVGAGTFHPETFLRAIGPEPWHAAHVQASRRPTDGRYGEHPNRGQHFFQYQVVLKPAPYNMQELYLESLQCMGIDPLVHDIRFVEDNWESPTLGAWGLGWEVWLDGMEITQFTYFQQMGGLPCAPMMGEIAYGIERLAMVLQDVRRTQDLIWTEGPLGCIRYGDIFQNYEREMSVYHFEQAHVPTLFSTFDSLETEAKSLIDAQLSLPAYELVLKASHIFNILDARRAISVSERQRFILRIRALAMGVATLHQQAREALGFPLLKNLIAQSGTTSCTQSGAAS